MKEADSSFTRGILNVAAGRDKFKLSRFEPAPLLKSFVDHYWAIRYDLHVDKPYIQTILSYPNVHLAFEQDDGGRRALIYGIPDRPFVRELQGAGQVLGVKFNAGGFYPFWKRDVAVLTGSTTAASELFGPDADRWTNTVFDAGDDAAMAQQAEVVLSTKLPIRDFRAELAARIVRETMNDRDIIKSRAVE